MDRFWVACFLLLLTAMHTRSKLYIPVQILEFKDNLNRSHLSLTHSEGIKRPVTTINYCARGPNNSEESVMKSRSDPKILEAALPEFSCQAPVKISREINDETSKRIIPSFYSLFGFYVTSGADMTGYFGDIQNEMRNVSAIADINAPNKRAGGTATFVELYKSVDTFQHQILYYRYTLLNDTLHTYEKRLPNIIKYINNSNDIYLQDTCYGEKMEAIFSLVNQKRVFNNYIEKMNDPSIRKILREHISQPGSSGYFRLAHLVPMSHLLFEGNNGLHGNCSIVGVWHSVYEHLAKVDEDIFNFALKMNGTAHITTGITGVLKTYMGIDFNLYNPESGFTVPEYIWKRVQIKFSDGSVAKTYSFGVTITNNPFLNRTIALRPFQKGEPVCRKSCEVIENMIEKLSKTISNKEQVNPSGNDNLWSMETKSTNAERIVNCCESQDVKWKDFQTLKSLNKYPHV